MNEFNEFYPISESMMASPTGLWQIQMVLKLAGHRARAQAGNAEAESKLVNRIGQLRRCVMFSHLSGNLKEEVDASIKWLKTTGRVFDLRNEDPRMWISNRSGNPRW